MINFFERNKYLIFILLVSLIIYFRWLSFSIFASADYGFQFFNTLKEIPSFGIWNSFGLGSVNLLPWRLIGPNNLLFGLFGFLGFNSNIADKFVIMWPWVILPGVCSYFLIKKITKSGIGGLIGSFVFSYNTYFLAINTQGHSLLSIASIFSVLSLLFFIKSLEEKKLHLVILTALSLFITGIYDLRLLYISIWLLFFYSVYFLIVNNKFSNYKKILVNSLVAFSPIIIVFLLNIFWVAASSNAIFLAENPVLSRPLFGSGFFDITKAITLFHPFWTGGEIDWFIVQKIPFYFWLIPIFASFGLILNKKNKNVVFFGIIALIGIFLSKQVAAPFGGVYKWLFENFPGFNSFREASKFYFLTALGYSVLIGVFTAWLWENWNGKKWHIYGKYLLIFLISFIFLWNTKPIITGEVGSMFVPRHIPNDYLILKDFILKQDGFFRTFWTPTAPRWGVYTNQKPKIINIVVIRNEWKDYVPLNSGYNNLSINKQITEIFKIKRAFDNSSIKYVVVPIDDISNDSDPFFYYGREKNPDIRNWYISELNKVGWLKKIDIGTKELVVYENENYKPHIYSSTTPTIIAGDIEALILLTETKYLDGKSVLLFTGGKRKEDANEEIVVVKKGKEEPEITFKKINPTKYLVKVEGAKAPFWLVFSESFHKQWRLYNKEKVEKKEDGVFEEIVADYPKLKVKEAKHLIKFTPKDIKCLFRKPLNAKHQLVNGYANGWYVEPRELELGEDFTLIMYFWPQSLFYLGLGISGLTLLFCIGYLGFSFVKRKKGKIASLSVRNDKKGVLDETKN